MQGNHLNQPNNLCKFCYRAHIGECRREVGLCFQCSKSCHYIRECPLLLDDNKKPNPPQSSRSPTRDNTQRNSVPAQVFALTLGEAVDNIDVIIGILPLFSQEATVLFDCGAIHSFVLVDHAKFHTLEAEKLGHSLVVSIPTGNSVICNKILHGCPISIEGRLMLANLVVFQMFWFNIILGMDWLASNYTSIDYSKKEVVFKPPKGDPIGRRILDWRKRVHIIEGIIQGLLYLQEYSNFTIIHRDLKGNNILLDKDMNPKISDFGIAILFGKDEHEANTNRIVGT